MCATPAGCYEGRQVLWLLDAGRAPAYAARHTVQRGPRVRGESNVGCDQNCHIALLGLSLPQLPPYQSPYHVRSGGSKDGEVAPWLQSVSISSHTFFGCHRDEMADAMIEAVKSMGTNAS